MNKVRGVLLLVILMMISVVGYENVSAETATHELTNFEKSLIGEWEYIVGGVCTGGGAYDNSVVGQKGTFTFFDNGEFQLIENNNPNIVEKGTFKESNLRVIRIYFENEAKYEEEVYLEFNDASNNNSVNWVIIRRDESGIISDLNTEGRSLVMKKVK